MAKADFMYDGRHSVVLGGATGMGAAVAGAVMEFGGRVTVLDHVPVTLDTSRSIVVDLRHRDQIDAALQQMEDPVDALFCCAGVADGPDVLKINFISHRYIIEQMLERGQLISGSAICMISSVGGLGWEKATDNIRDFLSNTTFEDAVSWTMANSDANTYSFSKQAMNYYVAHESYRLWQQGIRINSIMPGPTDTPLARANADVWLAFAADYRAACHAETLTPEEMANVMVFLNSRAARGVNGVPILVDQGHVNASLTDAFDAPFVKMLAGIESEQNAPTS